MLKTFSALALAVAVPLGLLHAAQPPQKQKDENRTLQKHVYLGLEVESLPPAIASNLPELLPKGQGVLVMHVRKDSPAAKAGIQDNDIILTYNDHKLFSAEQLHKLVQADKSGQEVNLGIVRGGKSQTLKVALGEHDGVGFHHHPHVFQLIPDDNFRQMLERFESKLGTTSWETFDAMKLSRLDNNRWRAEIEYRAKDGKKEHKTFEGTREEIRKDIQATNDLPPDEGAHLLRALDAQNRIFEFHFPPTAPKGRDGRNSP